MEISNEKIKYLSLLAEKYPSNQAALTEIINLEAIRNLPKGTEHFMSDIHGEYEPFYHILNNCSGVIREKVNTIFKEAMTSKQRSDLCTLIYYPKEKIKKTRKEKKNTYDWYKNTLERLVELSKHLSSKYTRSKVRKALPKEFSYIIDELLHVQEDEDNNQFVYHKKIIDTIIFVENGDEFIIALANMIKRLAVDHLHIVGDIFDRGPRADSIMDLLIEYHSLDIEWGNHDILWMGAAAGSKACIATVIRNNLNYQNMQILENGYGISLRSLILFAEKTYKNIEDPVKAAVKAITVILFKLEGKIIMRHKEYELEDRLLLDKIDYKNKSIKIDGITYQMNDTYFPTVNKSSPYTLTEEESNIMYELKSMFKSSEKLNKHVSFLYSEGSIYRSYNQNLLFHGCVPLDKYGNFLNIEIDGKIYKGKSYMDYAEKIARLAYFGSKNQSNLDFMWFLWCCEKSPLSGRNQKTFERTFINDEKSWVEPKNYYYKYYQTEQTCNMILHEFGLYSSLSHIINGHTPVQVKKGESPLKANGKLIVIDGGFCKAYQKATGIAGYTLIYNSHGMRIVSHTPFESVEKALDENKDIDSESDFFETEAFRVMVSDTDIGKKILSTINDIKLLLSAYKSGVIIPKKK